MPIMKSDILQRLAGATMLVCFSGTTLAYPCIEAYVDGNPMEAPLVDSHVKPDLNNPGFYSSPEPDSKTTCLDDLGDNGTDAINTSRISDGLGAYTSLSKADQQNFYRMVSISPKEIFRIDTFLLDDNEVFTGQWHFSDDQWDDYEALTILWKNGAYVVETETSKRNADMVKPEDYFDDWSIPDGGLSHFTVLTVRER